jgi:hypothetical protein
MVENWHEFEIALNYHIGMNSTCYDLKLKTEFGTQNGRKKWFV